MAVNASPAAPVTSTPSTRNSSLRYRAIGIFVLLILEILLGNQLAVVGSPYPWPYLAAHIVLSLLLLGFTAHVLLASVRLGGGVAARASAGLTFLSALLATVGGTAFLYAGGSQWALYLMEGFGVFGLLAAILLMVWGSVPVRSPPAPAP
jgi:hypothetical protein